MLPDLSLSPQVALGSHVLNAIFSRPMHAQSQQKKYSPFFNTTEDQFLAEFNVRDTRLISFLTSPISTSGYRFSKCLFHLPCSVAKSNTEVNTISKRLSEQCPLITI